uniref:Uncharacterized protein n=1 Tax=Musa acuminata subsp. malaccensis TaxID=214687 RepID=A0A804IB71_MUSAM
MAKTRTFYCLSNRLLCSTFTASRIGETERVC